MIKLSDKKVVKVFSENSEGKMDLKIKGKHSVEQSIKIMKAFDEGCNQIKNKNKEEE